MIHWEDYIYIYIHTHKILRKQKLKERSESSLYQLPSCPSTFLPRFCLLITMVHAQIRTSLHAQLGAHFILLCTGLPLGTCFHISI